MIRKLMMKEAQAVAADLKLLLEDIRRNDLQSAGNRIAQMQKTVRAARGPVNRSEALFASVPQMHAKLKTARKLLDTAELALSEIAKPAVELLEAYPVARLRAGEGMDAELAGRYLDFADNVMPKLEQVVKAAGAVDLTKVDPEGQLLEYLDSAKRITGFYRREKAAIGQIRAMIGRKEEDSLEISGIGGSACRVQLRDGILTLSD